MRILLFLLITLGMVLSTRGQGFRMDWAHGIGSNGGDETFDLASDSKGNLYISGYFENSVDFNPSSQAINSRTSTGFEDLFVLKLDSLGLL